MNFKNFTNFKNLFCNLNNIKKNFFFTSIISIFGKIFKKHKNTKL